jgi:hypothetical protein
MHLAFVLAPVLTLVACGGAPAAAPTTSAPKRSVGPRCPAGAVAAPSDARTRMEALRDDVFACFGLGTQPPTDGMVKVELSIEASGRVQSAMVTAEGAEASAVRCTEGVLRKTRFAEFCGDDVSISWSYTLR